MKQNERDSSAVRKIGAEVDHKLAYKTGSAPIFTWDGHQMLPDRNFPVRKIRHLNCYE